MSTDSVYISTTSDKVIITYSGVSIPNNYYTNYFRFYFEKPSEPSASCFLVEDNYTLYYSVNDLNSTFTPIIYPSVVSGNSSKYDIFFDRSIGKEFIYAHFEIDRPLYEVVLASGSPSYSIGSRATSFTGDLGILGDNGQLTKVDGDQIFNETTNNYYNPSTGTTSAVTDWTYDYSDRSYHLTMESGDTVTVTYGDENITIQEGDTVYKLGKFLGTLGDGLLDFVLALIGKVLDWLISLAEFLGDKLVAVAKVILDIFDFLPGLFTGFLTFLESAFGFLPTEIVMILTFGIAAIVFIGIIKAIRR